MSLINTSHVCQRCGDDEDVFSSPVRCQTFPSYQTFPTWDASQTSHSYFAQRRRCCSTAHSRLTLLFLHPSLSLSLSVSLSPVLSIWLSLLPPNDGTPATCQCELSICLSICPSLKTWFRHLHALLTCYATMWCPPRARPSRPVPLSFRTRSRQPSRTSSPLQCRRRPTRSVAPHQVLSGDL